MLKDLLRRPVLEDRDAGFRQAEAPAEFGIRKHLPDQLLPVFRERCGRRLHVAHAGEAQLAETGMVGKGDPHGREQEEMGRRIVLKMRDDGLGLEAREDGQLPT